MSVVGLPGAGAFTLAVLVGHWELIAILIVALLIFGSRLPKVMRSIGRSITQFKRGLREAEDEIASAAEEVEDEGGADDSSSPAG